MASSVGHSRFLVITSGLLICTIVVDARNICNHDQYTVLSENRTFSYCRDCPPCHIGTGLTYECGSVINTEAEVKCIDCVDGSTFNDIDEGQSVVCKGCNREEHRVVRKPCTKTQDTQYADACEPGYYFVGATMHNGPCIPCTCCNKGNLQSCFEVGPKTRCQCPVVNADLTNDTNTVGHNATAGPVTSQTKRPTGTLTDQSSPVITSNKDNQMEPWVIPVAIIVVAVVIIFVCIIVLCWRFGPCNSYTDEEPDTASDSTGTCSSNDQKDSMELDNLEGACLLQTCSDTHERSNLVPQTLRNLVQLPQNVPECSLSKVEHPLRSYLSMKLDIAGVKAYLAGWREVGKHFSVPSSRLDLLELEYRRPAGSPTEGLFNLLETRGDNQPTLKEILKVLIEIRREDIISGWNWQANKEIEQ